MNVNVKYIKDETGNIISPVASTDSVFDSSSNSLTTLLSGISIPIGAIQQFAGTSIPSTWLLCNGRAISRTTYISLFSVIGTAYGKGDGSTTFNLPNLQGKIPVGKNEDDIDFDTLGETGGNKSVSHTHETSNLIAGLNIFATGGRQYIDYAVRTDKVSYTENARQYVNADAGEDEHSEGSATGVGIFGSTDSTSISTLQPYIVVNYIIKASLK